MPPTIQFRDIPLTTLTTALNTPAKRLGVIAGESVVSTGVGNELDFGNVDISLGQADSTVKMLLWNVTANGGFTTVSDFKLWNHNMGYTQAASKARFKSISGPDNGSPVNTENYIVNATPASYAFSDMPTTTPGATNVYQTDETAGINITTPGTSDDSIMVAMYHQVAAGETVGVYERDVLGFEHQYTFEYLFA